MFPMEKLSQTDILAGPAAVAAQPPVAAAGQPPLPPPSPGAQQAPSPPGKVV